MKAHLFLTLFCTFLPTFIAQAAGPIPLLNLSCSNSDGNFTLKELVTDDGQSKRTITSKGEEMSESTMSITVIPNTRSSLEKKEQNLAGMGKLTMESYTQKMKIEMGGGILSYQVWMVCDSGTLVKN